MSNILTLSCEIDIESEFKDTVRDNYINWNAPQTCGTCSIIEIYQRNVITNPNIEDDPKITLADIDSSTFFAKLTLIRNPKGAKPIIEKPNKLANKNDAVLLSINTVNNMLEIIDKNLYVQIIG